ncbi:O-antigen ligase family protein [uncultured Psychroserpens sp.]|uniref:O-antigen ligase family protein n=1 Tax=uncultured Psychroserpens sp. TaxID=255436 RepID=UPI00262D4E20|nr:O-antigen ligase family protein [uncultured Psychroserpens sp.]
MSKNDTYIGLVLLHIALAFVIFTFNATAKFFFVGLIFYFLIKIVFGPSKDKVINVLLACAYFVGIEVFFRMTKSSLAYESAKYLIILFMIIGMVYKGISGKGYPYFLYLILLVPAILVASVTLSYNANFRTSVAFVLSGPVCLGVAALFCYDRKVSSKDLIRIVKYISLPLISTTTYLFLYNPSIKETLSGTASNAATSGGFGPNQVATVLGMGMFVMVVRFFLKSPSLILKILNVTILAAMTFRAIITFSRGGVVAAIIVILAFLWSLFFKSTLKQKNQIITSFALFVVAVIVTWVISSNLTFGLIDKRYANQDALGREKQDITSGRITLFIEELEGFQDSPFLGVGVNKTKDLRAERDGTGLPSHNEVGRLMSEHGILGILILLILIFTPLAYRGKNRKNLLFYAFLSFWFATINHSGMRIAAPSFMYALALLNITNEKNPIHRKQIKQDQ